MMRYNKIKSLQSKQDQSRVKFKIGVWNRKIKVKKYNLN